MADPSSPTITVIFPQEHEAWNVLLDRVKAQKGEILLMLSGREDELTAAPSIRKTLFDALKKRGDVRIASKHPSIIAEARGYGLPVVDRTNQMKRLLKDHPKLPEVLQLFSPQLWRQQLTSRLQRLGFLSLPKLRIGLLLGFSIFLFLFVIIKLLPSAEVRIRPRRETLMQTANIMLVRSGATIAIPDAVRKLPLVPATVRLKETLSFRNVSKEFIGTSAEVELTVINTSDEEYALTGGTRFATGQGLIFRSLTPVTVPAGGKETVRAKADDFDTFGEVIGERGNLPAGLTWTIPGLSPDEQKLVYAENSEAALGGTTAYRMILREEDLPLLQKRFEQEMHRKAVERLQDEIALKNARSEQEQWEMLEYDELKYVAFSGITLPVDAIGGADTEVNVSGEVIHSALTYDAAPILAYLRQDLKDHVREGKELLADSVGYPQMVVNVIDYAEDHSWIKLTVDLTGTEQYVLDPLSPEGAMFAMDLRKRIAGKTKEEAHRIVQNMPEVESVRISTWPPWSGTLPDIASHISIVPVDDED